MLLVLFQVFQAPMFVEIQRRKDGDKLILGSVFELFQCQMIVSWLDQGARQDKHIQELT